MPDILLIDRKPAMNHFVNMLDGTSTKRVLRITGPEKMGKSRLLREYSRLSKEHWRAQCALSDLRSKLQGFDDILFNITQHIGSVYFPNYRATQGERTQPRIEISRLSQLFSLLNINMAENKTSEEQHRRRITSAFMQDLHLMPPNIPVILLFDAYEEASANIQDWINEQLISGLIQLPNVYIVLAGRNLPEVPQTWLDVCFSYELPPVLFEDQKDYCIRVGIDLEDDVIRAFHEAFDGRPGLFAEYTSKFPIKKLNEPNQ